MARSRLHQFQGFWWICDLNVLLNSNKKNRPSKDKSNPNFEFPCSPV